MPRSRTHGTAHVRAAAACNLTLAEEACSADREPIANCLFRARNADINMTSIKTALKKEDKRKARTAPDCPKGGGSCKNGSRFRPAVGLWSAMAARRSY